jgi:hypothetical protein
VSAASILVIFPLSCSFGAILRCREASPTTCAGLCFGEDDEESGGGAVCPPGSSHLLVVWLQTAVRVRDADAGVLQVNRAAARPD